MLIYLYIDIFQLFMHYSRSLLWKKGWNFLVFTNLETQLFKSNFIRAWSNYWIEYDDTNFEFRNLPAQKSLYKKTLQISMHFLCLGQVPFYSARPATILAHMLLRTHNYRHNSEHIEWFIRTLFNKYFNKYI